MKIKSANHLRGTLNLPGDKSISHRAAMFSALTTGGEAKIENFASSADCRSTLSCLERLGVEIIREETTVFIKGVGKNGFHRPSEILDCGNSGTTVRLLAGILAGQKFESVLSGDESLSVRPMRRVIEPLTQMQARIESENDCAPLKIFGKNPLRSIAYSMNVASAQVKSCVLLAGLNADGVTTIRNPKAQTPTPSSRNHTELMLKYLGADLRENYIESGDGKFVQEISISGDSQLEARDFRIPSDVSSAAFFLVAAACLENSDLILKNVGLNPTRRAIIDVLRKFGANIEITEQKESGYEIVGDLRVTGSGEFQQLSENKIEGDIIANLIDEIPILAVFGTQLKNGLEIRNAKELRYKESDRIKAIVENLRRMNADAEEFEDGLRVGKSDLRGARIDSFGDHRIAMAFAVAGLLATGETEIVGAECVAVSFPDFFRKLSSVTIES